VQKDRCTLQHSHQHDALAGVVFVDLAADLGGALGDLPFAEEDREILMNVRVIHRL